MKPVAIFRHSPTEGPGYFATYLHARGLPWQLVKLDEGEAVPAGVGTFSGLVFMGGPMSVNDDLPWIAPVLELIRKAVPADVPVLGHCLGGQLMSKALGGSVGRNPVKEIGWGEIEVADNPDWVLTVEFLEQWEAKHGRIPARNWLAFRTDWSRRWTRDADALAYQNFDEQGQHTPGPSSEAVQWLVEQRQVLGFGSEAIGTDAGQGAHLRPPYPCHTFMHGSGRYGLQCLTNLDQLPPTGSVLVCPPLKIQHGSGSPLRVLALVA